MCGLVGVASSLMSTNLNSAFKDLLYFDAVRGWDATGMAVVSKDKGRAVRIKKRAVPSYQFLADKSIAKKINTDAKLFLGHNRAATAGAVVDRNSHPFNHGHITMAHNGTLNTHIALPKKSDKYSFDVDSEAICHALYASDTINVLEQLNGAFALVWYNQRDDTLNFARNSKRPLFYAISNAGSTMLWASEKPMLEAAIDRNLSIKFTIHELPVGEHKVFDMSSMKFDDHVTNNFTPRIETHYRSSWYDEDWRPSPLRGHNHVGITPTSAELMKTWGYLKRDEIIFEMDRFVPYQHANRNTTLIRGKILGYEGITGLPVVIHSMYDTDFKQYSVARTRLDYMSAQEYGCTKEFPALVNSGGSLQHLSKKEIEEFVDTYSAYKGFGENSPFLKGGNQDSASSTERESSSQSNIIPYDVKLADGEVIITRDFQRHAKDGCAWCSGSLSLADASSLIKLSGDGGLIHQVCYAQFIAPTTNDSHLH